MTQLIGLVQVLVSKLPALPAVSPAGRRCMYPFLYIRIYEGGYVSDDTSKKILGNFVQDFKKWWC